MESVNGLYGLVSSSRFSSGFPIRHPDFFILVVRNFCYGTTLRTESQNSRLHSLVGSLSWSTLKAEWYKIKTFA